MKQDTDFQIRMILDHLNFFKFQLLSDGYRYMTIPLFKKSGEEVHVHIVTC